MKVKRSWTLSLGLALVCLCGCETYMLDSSGIRYRNMTPHPIPEGLLGHAADIMGFNNDERERIYVNFMGKESFPEKIWGLYYRGGVIKTRWEDYHTIRPWQGALIHEFTHHRFYLDTGDENATHDGSFQNMVTARSDELRGVYE